ncbi:FHA domain-containing protein [Profundibacter sp.]
MSNDKTKWIFDNDDDTSSNLDSDFTESIGAETIGTTDVGFDDPTQVSGDDETTRLMPSNEKTQIFLPGQSGATAASVNYDDLQDPVVGWLVVVKGPGLGQSVPIGVGMNTVGRDTSSRIALDFGDKMISGEDHARIIYDDDSRGFFIAHGTGKSITKVNGKMVATTMPLENYDVVEITKATHLRFVAFCNEKFDWSDLADKG